MSISVGRRVEERGLSTKVGRFKVGSGRLEGGGATFFWEELGLEGYKTASGWRTIA